MASIEEKSTFYIKAGFRVEEQETKPTIEQFRAAGKIRSVNANRSIEEVFADLSMHFEVLDKRVLGS
jgi:adenylate kinase family enzyme